MEDLLTLQNIIYRLENPPRRVAIRATGVAAGEVLAVRGPSGSGKTTLLRILARLQPPLDGEVSLEGHSWHEFPPTRWRRRVQLVAQEPVRFEGSVRENLERPFRLAAVHFEEAFEPDAAEALLSDLGLSLHVLQQEARLLSGGEAARVALVRALLLRPTVLLLDEPTAALDDVSRQRLIHVLQRWLTEGPPRALLLVSHAGEERRFPAVTHIDIRPEEVS